MTPTATQIKVVLDAIGYLSVSTTPSPEDWAEWGYDRELHRRLQRLLRRATAGLKEELAILDGTGAEAEAAVEVVVETGRTR